MSFRILVGVNGNVDFDGAVEMSSGQLEAFIQMMKGLYAFVRIEKGEDFRTERIGDKVFQKEWTSDEYRALLPPYDTAQAEKMLGRSWMSVQMRAGQFLPSYLAYIDERGESLVGANAQTLIEEFLAEQKAQQLEKRAHKKKEKDALKKLIREHERLGKLTRSMNLQKACGQGVRDVDNKIAEVAQKRAAILDQIDKMGYELDGVEDR